MDGKSVTLNNYKEFLRERLTQRLSEIRWGENADGVEDAMNYTEEYIVGDVKDAKVRNQICVFMMQGGMVAKSKLKKREMKDYSLNCIWSMKVKPVNEFFAEIWECFERSYDEFYSEREKELRTNFINYWNEFMSNDWQFNIPITTRSSIDRKIYEKLIKEFSAKRLVTVYTKYTACNDVLLVSKTGDFRHWPQFFEEQYYKGLALNVDSFHTWYDICKWHRSLQTNGTIDEKSQQDDMKYLAWHCAANLYELVKSQFEAMGYNVFIFPRKRPEEYVQIGFPAYNEIMIYLEECET